MEILGPGAGPRPSDWMLASDSPLAAFLRMLADLPDPDTVAAAIAQGVLFGFRPLVSAIGFIRPDEQLLVTVGVFGGEPRLRPLYAVVPLDTDIPATRCYRTNAVVSTMSDRLAVDFPLLAPYVNSNSAPSPGESTVFPIRSRGQVVAVLGLDFASPLPEPWSLRSAVATVSGPLALWAVLRMQLDDSPEVYWAQRPDRPLTVTDRQKSIIALVRQGQTNPQIASELGFSVPTIKAELARLCALLGATSRADLAVKAERAGL